MSNAEAFYLPSTRDRKHTTEYCSLHRGTQDGARGVSVSPQEPSSGKNYASSSDMCILTQLGHINQRSPTMPPTQLTVLSVTQRSSGKASSPTFSLGDCCKVLACGAGCFHPLHTQVPHPPALFVKKTWGTSVSCQPRGIPGEMRTNFFQNLQCYTLHVLSGFGAWFQRRNMMSNPPKRRETGNYYITVSLPIEAFCPHIDV